MFRFPRALLLLAFALPVWCGAVRADLTTALQVRSLGLEEADSGVPVEVEGVVIFSDPPGTVFLQDSTAGTFFQLKGREAPAPGDQIRVRGESFPGLYLPGIAEADFEILGHPGIPEAIAATYDDLISGRFHYQYVAIEGIVRTISADENGASVVRVALGSRVVEVRVEALSPPDLMIVGSRVRVSGLAAGEVNNRRQLVFPYLRSRNWDEVEILEAAKLRASIVEVSPEQLLNFAVGGQELHQVRVIGTVLAALENGEMYLRCGESAVGVSRLPSEHQIESGDTVEMLGFPEMDRFSARLVDAVIVDHFLGDGPPVPLAVELSSLLDGSHECDLVTLEAELMEQFRNEEGSTFLLRDGVQTIRAYLPDHGEFFEAGTRLRVTGIALVESTRRSAQYTSEPDQVALKLRSPADIAMINAPAWWTSQRLATALISLFAVMILAALWITLLQRQVSRQTAALRDRIENEAVLEERQHIAREFHDTLEQDLAGLSLRLDAAVARGGDEKLTQLITGSRSLVSRIQTETRNLVSDLRQMPGEGSSLVEALGEIAVRRVDQLGPVITFLTGGEIPELPARTVHHLKMIAQESVTNALKHAAAATIGISVDCIDGRLVMRISDDGAGIDSGAETKGGSGHFGCMGMRERCRKIGGVIAWKNGDVQGTVVEVILPVEREEGTK